MQVPMSSPDITDAEIEAVNAVLKTPVLSIGPWIRRFEAEFASYFDARHAVAVSSGTAALHMAVVALGIGEGDCVVTSPFSFVSSANCLLYENAVPVFVDVDERTGNLDPEALRAVVEAFDAGGRSLDRHLPRSIRQNRGQQLQLKGVLPVHAFGQPADMDPILEVARSRGLAVIEDACEAVGATYKGKMAGLLGDAGAFAFYPNKQMTTGEGGMLVTNRDDLASLFRSLRNQGRDIFDSWLNHTRLGYNYRLSELASALGVTQLQRIDELLAKREAVAGWYQARLRTADFLRIPQVVGTTSRMSWFVYVVRFHSAEARTRAIQALQAQGIPSRPYFSPIHLQPFYARRFGYERGDFPATERLGECCLALPFSGVMQEKQVDRVCEVLAEAFDQRSSPDTDRSDQRQGDVGRC